MNLLFDLDGTLSDPRRGIVDGFKHALDACDCDAPGDGELEGFIGPPLNKGFARLLNCTEPATVERAVALYRERFSAQGLYENVLYAGIREALAQLSAAGHPLYVATSKPDIFAQRIVDHLGIREFFRAVYGSELDGTNADKTNLIAHIVSVESLLPHDTLMVGDRAHDVIGAKMNGVSCIGALWGYGSRRELIAAGAQTVCETPRALVEAVSSINAPNSAAVPFSPKRDG